MSPVPSALSVVVVRFAGGDALASTLRALATQQGAPSFDVVVAEEEGSPAAAIPTALQGRLTSVRAPRGVGPARLRSLGVRASMAPLVAVTEDHVTPAGDWCAAIAAAHARQAEPAIGGTIAPAASLRGADLAFSLLTYARYFPPLPAGPVDYLSDCNVTYKRSALDAVADAWRDEFVETVVHAALRSKGGALLLDPTLRTEQGRAIDLSAARAEQREHGEVFARARVAGASPAVRAIRAATAIALPALLTARSCARGVARGCSPAAVASAAPALLALSIAWSTGELHGYLSSGT